MAEQQSKINKQNQLSYKDRKQQWIENEEYCIQGSTKPSNEFDQEFKKQHQQYLTLKNKRKEEALRKKIDQFGQSSSDQDLQQDKKSPKKTLNQQMKLGSVKKEQKQSDMRYGYNCLKESGQLKKEKETKYGSQKSVSNKIQILTSLKKGSEYCVKQEVSINQKTIVFPNSNYPFYDISKFKLIFTSIDQGYFKLKINWKNQQIIFASSFKQKVYELPTAYFIFCKVINLKLSLMGKNISSFSGLKNTGISEFTPKNSYVCGKLLKKSRVLSRWSEIFAFINENGLFYHKKANEKGQLLVQRSSISELWTRFQFQGEFLIIKLFENGHKIELGIPIQDYTSTNSWLYHLYNLVFKNA